MAEASENYVGQKQPTTPAQIKVIVASIKKKSKATEWPEEDNSDLEKENKANATLTTARRRSGLAKARLTQTYV